MYMLVKEAAKYFHMCTKQQKENSKARDHRSVFFIYTKLRTEAYKIEKVKVTLSFISAVLSPSVNWLCCQEIFI